MSVNPGSTIVGFIGTGVMGRSMAGHILSAGYRLHVHNRTRARAEDLLARGAGWCDSPAELAPRCDVIVTMLGYPADVQDVYLSARGLIDAASPGTLLIDMTTSSPALARQIHAEAVRRGLHAMDAPVSGGDVGAREGRLSIMVGGSPRDFQEARPILQTMGRNIVLQGAAGSGQHTKMANQIAIAANMVGVCEALAYARCAGLDPERVLQSIGGGAAASWSLANMAPRILRGDYAPGFYVKHFMKDMAIALESARELGLEMPGLALARDLYRRVEQAGGAELGTQALFRLYDHATPDHHTPDPGPTRST